MLLHKHAAHLNGRLRPLVHDAAVPGFVDVHSHCVPSGDDGVVTADEGLALVVEAGRRGTRVLIGTPHANFVYPMTPDRTARTRAAHAEMAPAAAAAGVDLQLGWELGPEPWLLEADPRDFRLGRLDAALLEFPLPHFEDRGLELVLACAEHIEAAGLLPVLGHPERSPHIQADPELVRPFRERGWLLQVNATSLLGRHDRASERTGWTLVRLGWADLVASDGHRARRPPFLDEAHDALIGLVGWERADALACGAALGLAADAAAPARSERS
jgi:protein-tyrosine phosphatase